MAKSAQTAYQDVGGKAAKLLGLDPPEGGTFLFLDLADAIDRHDAQNIEHGRAPRGLLGVLEQCADQGLLLAPGESFGPYPHMARFCFTCVEPERTLRGARLLQGILAP